MARRYGDGESGVKSPKWVCFRCGYKAAKRSYEVSAWHMGKCDVCKEWKPVTGPRDFFYPKFTKRER
jgi:predicted ATP-dependent serine protease